MLKQIFFVAAILVAIAVMAAVPSGRDQALAASPAAAGLPSIQRVTTASGLSSYWHTKVQRWSELIVQEAERRDLDPDLLASLVWMESRGDSQAVGPVGAVGLMQVMPREAGFGWRPTQEALMDPGTNLFWGTRTLATVIRQGKGDIFNALAAYNGGWEQTMYRGPKRFATTILRDYAHAVVLRHGLTGSWTAVFAVKGPGVRGPIWVAEDGRDDVYAFGDENVTPEGGPLVPDVASTAVLASCFDAEIGVPCEVGVWLFDGESQQWVLPNEVRIEPQAAPAAPSVYVMAGSARPDASASPSPVVSAPAPTSPPPVITVASVGDASVAGPTVSATETRMPVNLETPETSAPETSLPACAGGPLTVDAWPLDKDFIVGTETTPEGWKVRIYAEGRGGDCVYTYAWNDESDIRAENVRGATTFEVTSTRRDCVILGTVVVISGDSVQRVGMYIHPPK